MNEKEALLLIEDMISRTREDVKDNGFYYMLWGWLVFVAALIDYVLMVFMNNPDHAVVWGIMMPSGGVISFIAGMREAKQIRVKTYLDESVRVLVTAFVVSLVIVCIIMPMNSNTWKAFFPTLMVIYAFGIYMFGGMLRYKPLQYGAFANWALAVAGFFSSYDIQLLLLALAVACGFIIPGHLLNRRFNRNV
jgi:hypothetical protein